MKTKKETKQNKRRTKDKQKEDKGFRGAKVDLSRFDARAQMTKRKKTNETKERTAECEARAKVHSRFPPTPPPAES